MIGKIMRNTKKKMVTEQTNLFDEVIEECCSNPITGFFRNGFCHTDELDLSLIHI